MQNDSIKKANETYDKIEEILKGRTFPSWKEFVNKHKDNIEAAREEYNSHEVVKEFNAAQFHIWGDFYEDFEHSRSEYIDKCKNAVMVPYAVVKDGKWYQKGEMGWWDMINSLEPTTQLTLVDFHI